MARLSLAFLPPISISPSRPRFGAITKRGTEAVHRRDRQPRSMGEQNVGILVLDTATSPDSPGHASRFRRLFGSPAKNPKDQREDERNRNRGRDGRIDVFEFPVNSLENEVQDSHEIIGN